MRDSPYHHHQSLRGGRSGQGGRHPTPAPDFYPQSPPPPGDDGAAYYHYQQQEYEYQYQQQFDYAPPTFGSGISSAGGLGPGYEHPAQGLRRPPTRGGGGGGRSGGNPPWRHRSIDLDDPTLVAASAAAVAAFEGGAGGGGFSDELAGKPRGGSMEVRNDYSQHFLQTGERPQNFIRDATVDEGFAEYPKLARLLAAKDALVESRHTPPMCLNADLRAFDLRSLGTKFDVIYIDPPWEEYAWRAAPFVVAGHGHTSGGGGGDGGCDASQDLATSVWRYEELEALPIDEIGAFRDLINLNIQVLFDVHLYDMITS